MHTSRSQNKTQECVSSGLAPTISGSIWRAIALLNLNQVYGFTFYTPVSTTRHPSTKTY
jgi:hypothetical protein